MGSGTISPLFPRCFSPFPHGTGSLSVSQSYLALPDGTGGFKGDSSGPPLLRILLALRHYRYGAITRYGRAFQRVLILPARFLQSYNPGRAVTRPVWALPRSLATTEGIILIFYSSGYLDVSVHRVVSYL